MSYQSKLPREPLSELEEAVLIAMTGCTGLTMPDRPFEDPATHKPVMAKPNLTMAGRTAGSPDNAQGTHFFLINDSGTYFLRKLPPPADGQSAFSAERLIARAREAKVRILDRRLDVPEGKRDFPAYLDSNRLLSNLPGTTILLPVVDLSRQYINGMMYILTQPDGARPTIVDDRNFYRPAGVKRWVEKGFLNKDLKMPLGAIGSLRTQIEADLLLQNLFLTADAMGLGGWIHASISPPVLVGDPKFTKTYGPMLGFDVETPRWRMMDLLRWHVPLPQYSNLRSNPIGLRFKGEHLIKGMSPPYYDSMADAVAAVVDASSARPASTTTKSCSRRSTRTITATAISARRQSTRRTSSTACATSAPTSTKRTAASRRIATPSTCPASGCRCTMSRSTITSASSATG